LVAIPLDPQPGRQLVSTNALIPLSRDGASAHEPGPQPGLPQPQLVSQNRSSCQKVPNGPTVWGQAKRRPAPSLAVSQPALSGASRWGRGKGEETSWRDSKCARERTSYARSRAMASAYSESDAPEQPARAQRRPRVPILHDCVLRVVNSGCYCSRWPYHRRRTSSAGFPFGVKPRSSRPALPGSVGHEPAGMAF